MPQSYELTASAREDLRAIARYTVSQWGIPQARRYQTSMEAFFQKLAEETSSGRPFIKRRSDLLLARFEHHFVFFVRRENKPLLIVAVFHEKMDLIRRIQLRLKD
jgi:toxin ParE1/3/4